MAGLTIRGIPGEDLDWLRERAARHGRSLNAEMLELIAVARADDLAAEHAESPFARTWTLARKLGVRTSPEARRIVRADRDRDPRP